MMGLVSFAFSMIAALILLLRPRDALFVLPRPARMAFTRRLVQARAATWSSGPIAER